MHLVVIGPTGERRFYGVPSRGALSIGCAIDGDVHITGHNIASRHVVLRFAPRISIDVRSAYGVRLDGRLPRPEDAFARGASLHVGGWELRLAELAAIASHPIEEAFFESFAREPDDPASRAVYADWLEERGRLPEADLLRADAITPDLAARTPPAWRRRMLPIAIEACTREACPRSWSELAPGADRDARTCGECARRVTFVSDIGTARVRAMHGLPIAIDPAVRRREDDLRKEPKKRLAVEMGRSAR